MSEASSAPESARPAAPPLPDPLRRNWVWWCIQKTCQLLFTIWFRYRARGIENLPAGGALLLVNHQSFLDPLLVGLPLTRPVSYLARDNLFGVPLVGWVLRSTYVMPIRREGAGTESIRESIRRMEHGFLVGIFPEGTRSEDSQLGELKPGFLALIRRVKVPVIPVAVAGAFEALPRGAWFPRPRSIRVAFGAPLDATRLAELSKKGRESELLRWTSEAIEQCLGEANAMRTGRPALTSD
ncbi:MAG: 1-acyl-sn-glycerol-3-phosphate acyltransferase [Planctomycetota bacterium]|nr:MAG: 1-acyl-sn-glycerol-3-phosphate acyltransferase [Planctomycetota bacterium]